MQQGGKNIVMLNDLWMLTRDIAEPYRHTRNPREVANLLVGDLALGMLVLVGIGIVLWRAPNDSTPAKNNQRTRRAWEEASRF